jgi:6-phosphofructokinase 2
MLLKKITVGAGDSMVGGMVWALSQNKSLKEVIRWGVACGSAATMNEEHNCLNSKMLSD